MEHACEVLTRRMHEDLEARGLARLASFQCSLDVVLTQGGVSLLILNRGDAAPPALIDYVPTPPGDPLYLITLTAKQTEWGRIMDRIVNVLQD